MTRTSTTLTWSLVLGIALASGLACKKKEAEAGHDHGTAAGHAGHEAPERPSFAPTLYTENMQLFVEYAVLVKGEVSNFGSHLTHLADQQAVKDGKAEIILTGAGGEQRFSTEVSNTPGIFRLAITPTTPGEVQVKITWKGPKGQATFELGKHTVYPDMASAMKAQVPEVTGGISFLKEQQWNVPYDIKRAQDRPMADGFEAYASVMAVPGGEGRVLASVAGRLEGNGFPSLGQIVKQGQPPG